MGVFQPLGERLSSRDNNLNLIRMVAATAVLISHAFPIALGPGTPEPARLLTGEDLGTIAVMVFFAASGFLIAASFARTPSLGQFVRARALRLMPGLIVSILLVAFVLGPLVSTLPVSAYLRAPDTWEFVLRNIALVKPQYQLPGVFETNPYPAVEGSIWTLVYEVLCYVGVVALGLAGVLARRGVATVLLCAGLALRLLLDATEVHVLYQIDMMLFLGQPFMLGTLAWLWRDRLPVSGLIGVVLVVVADITRNSALAGLTLAAAISYLTLLAAVLPDGAIRRYNRFGDYSYGMYVYAFPVQGLVIWIWGPMSPLANALLAFPITLALALLSWHLVEKPALSLVRRPPRVRPLPARPATSAR